MLSLLLTGAALIREREHGTIEHLLAMPVTPTQIMLAKVWSMSTVVLLATWLSITLVVRYWLQVPIAGSLPLFFLGVDRKSTRLNSSHVRISYAVFCLKKKKN